MNTSNRTREERNDTGFSNTPVDGILSRSFTADPELWGVAEHYSSATHINVGPLTPLNIKLGHCSGSVQ